MDLVFSQKIIDELGIPQIIDIRDKVPKNKNYDWSGLAGFRRFEDLDTIGLHHDAYPKKNRINVSPLDMINEIANEHIKNKVYDPGGEGGIPYHVYIIRGQAYYCNEISWRTYGIANHNGHVIHACIHGDYVNFDQLTDVDRNCIMAVCITLRSQSDIMPNLTLIKGHCELNPTDCPGYDYKSIRNDVVTVENRLDQRETWAAKLNKVGELGNQYNYMFDLIKAGETDGNARWAVENLLNVRDVMKEKGLL